MAKIALLGHGVVGSGVAEVIAKNGSGITRRAGEEIEIKYILDLRDFPELPYADKFIKDFSIIEKDPEISVVVEVIGGIKPAYDFVASSLRAGKSVVTSNKELVAEKGAQLLRLAKENNVNFLFEASVGGGIPIIRPIHQCLAANEIKEVAGILNGTTNYILTKMIEEQTPFEKALKSAQELGYAESDPTADIEGHDTCRKICILAALAFGHHIYPQWVRTRGITQITLDDVAYAKSAGYEIKLIGYARKCADGKIDIEVTPAFISQKSQLAGVDDVFNGILVRGNALGDAIFYGRGAGKLPTASAVVGDVIDCVKASGNIGSLYWEDAQEDVVNDILTSKGDFYIRIQGDGAETLFERCEEIFRSHQPAGEKAYIVHAVTENHLQCALASKGIALLSKIKLLDY